MKLLKQDGLSLKPVLIMLAIIGGLVYYMMKDIQKMKANSSVVTNDSEDLPVEESPSSTTIPPHEELLTKLAVNLKRPGACRSAFINREGERAKFLNSEEIPKSEDVVKILIDNETFLEIDQQVANLKVQDIYFSTTDKAPTVDEENTLLVGTELQVVWVPVQGGEAILGKPISLQLVTDSSGKLITGCKLDNSATSTQANSASSNPVQESPRSTGASAPFTAHKIQRGSICGVVTFECRGSFVGENPTIAPHQALNVDGTFCEGHQMNEPQCIFYDFQKGFRLEGLSCPEGYRPITHAGQLGDSENGEGATKTTNVLQLLMVLCVKQ